MQQSDRNEDNNKNLAESSIAIVACPRCGNGHTRRSAKKIKDKILKLLLYRAYRCQACRYRFWVMNPLRLVFCTGILLLFIPVLLAVWMAYHQQPKVAIPVEAVSHDQIKSLAEKGDPEAELKMGLRYTSIAWGVKNDKIAAEWFEKAARHDQVEAQYRYGVALLKGQGIVQDYKTAFYWLEKAAQQGHAKAQSTLGEMYNSGIAIKVDVERAYLWFNLAAAQGIESAASARDIVVKLLTPNQIAELQQEAIRISHGYRSSYVADESKTAAEELYPGYIDSSPADEPMPAMEEPTVKSIILMLKDWWKKQP